MLKELRNRTCTWLITAIVCGIGSPFCLLQANPSLPAEPSPTVFAFQLIADFDGDGIDDSASLVQRTDLAEIEVYESARCELRRMGMSGLQSSQTKLFAVDYDR